MILQALYEYYTRKASDPESGIAPEGFQSQEIKFVIVINEQGYFQELVDLRDKNGKGRMYLLPKAKSRSGKDAWKTAFLLWDHYGYVLCHPKADDEKSIEMAKNQHKAFIDEIKSLRRSIQGDKGVIAVNKFYENSQVDAVKEHPRWQDCAKIAGCNLTFRLVGDTQLIAEREAVVQFQQSSFLSTEKLDKNDSSTFGRCLITGDYAPIARLHTPTAIFDSKSNARLVSFQKSSGYDSYGKVQAFNAPISVRAESAYTTAMKHLLASKMNKQIIANSTVVFWAEKKPIAKGSFDLEGEFAWFIADHKDDPDRSVHAVRNLYEAIQTGKLSESKERFYVLALAPNAARISVRFFREGTIKDFAEKIVMHFTDFAIVREPTEIEHLPLYRILASIALQYKTDNIPPNLSGSVIESILDGTTYPITLMQQCIRRIRAEHNVTRPRAAILKAYLNRFNRINQPHEKELAMGLDPTNQNPGYRLGRLFAVLEKIQEEASPGINTTIRDRFYGAASTNPVAVFSQLLKLKNHHLAKLENPGRKVNMEKLIGEIMSEISDFPAHLSLQNQAYFSVGYYHQRQDFFTSKKSDDISL